jgi:hypothetical protein
MTKYDFLWWFVERPRRYMESAIHWLLGWGNPEIIQHECNKHRNEIVLDMFGVVKLLGWTDQFEDDFYYIVVDGYDVKLISCVGGLVWLKNKLDLWEYSCLQRTFEMNSSKELTDYEIKRKGLIIK